MRDPGWVAISNNVNTNILNGVGISSLKELWSNWILGATAAWLIAISLSLSLSLSRAKLWFIILIIIIIVYCRAWLKKFVNKQTEQREVRSDARKILTET